MRTIVYKHCSDHSFRRHFAPNESKTVAGGTMSGEQSLRLITGTLLWHRLAVVHRVIAYRRERLNTTRGASWQRVTLGGSGGGGRSVCSLVISRRATCRPRDHAVSVSSCVYVVVVARCIHGGGARVVYISACRRRNTNTSPAAAAAAAASSSRCVRVSVTSRVRH